MSLYDRAAIIAGRSATRSKAPDRLRKAWARSAEGAVLWDTDGKSYIDLVCGLGAISLGYNLIEGWRQGVFSLPHVCEIEAAEMVLQHVAPWASSMRPLKTGSESTHAAYRIAKAATGRDWVLVGDWAYHGWHEWCAPALHRFRHGEDLRGFQPPAAVFIEPHRWDPVAVDWLKDVRAWCTHVGALLVFDSMLYGGRWALGGASAYFGVQPDLECFGKAFGNGEAVAFVVGRDALAEQGQLVSGTFSGDVTGLSAVCDVLQTYTTEPVIETLWARGRQLKAGFDQVVPASFAWLDGAAPLQRIQFVNPDHKVPFKDAMAARGVLMYPDWFMTCFAHTEAQIDQVIAAAEASYQDVRTGQ
jgi:glutamate-1-semialdehyde aminotransferase